MSLTLTVDTCHTADVNIIEGARIRKKVFVCPLCCLVDWFLPKNDLGRDVDASEGLLLG